MYCGSGTPWKPKSERKSVNKKMSERRQWLEVGLDYGGCGGRCCDRQREEVRVGVSGVVRLVSSGRRP